MKTKILTLTLTFTLFSILMMSCTPAQPEIALEGTMWNLIFIGEQPVMPDSQVVLRFDVEGEFAGNAGCNSYFGSYTLNNERFKVGPVGNTEMACLEPEGLMEQEMDYLHALSAAEIISVSGETLEIQTTEGVTLIFEPVAP